MNEKLPDLDIMDVYAMFWRLLQFHTHYFGSQPTGQMLVTLTIVLLADAGYYPTVTELAEITGQPKSTVSRYVSTEMGLGYVEEIIDPHDRRRRLLRVTELARSERIKYRKAIQDIVQKTRVMFAENDKGERLGTELKDVLQGFLHFS